MKILKGFGGNTLPVITLLHLRLYYTCKLEIPRSSDADD